MLFDLLIVNVNEINKAAPHKIQILPLGEFADGKGRPFRVTPVK